MAAQWGSPPSGQSRQPSPPGDPFGGADPFAGADPFSGPDPFGGGQGFRADPFGAAPRPYTPPPPPPDTTPPAPLRRTPAPSPADSEKTVRISAHDVAPPATRPAAGFLLAGVAAALLTVAIMTGFAQAELAMFYGDVTVYTLAAMGALAGFAGLLCWQSVRCTRGRPRARALTVAAAAPVVLAAALVWVLTPGEQVAWYGPALRISSVAAGLAAVASMILLLRPAQSPAEPTAPAYAAATREPIAAAAPPPPGATRSAGPARPVPGADFDPFS